MATTNPPTANVDYINTVFEFPVLTRITDTPTFEALKTIKDELRANATSVQSDNGGGAHGHLGLVLTPAEYATVSLIAYVCPQHPGPNPPIGRTINETTLLCTQYYKAL